MTAPGQEHGQGLNASRGSLSAPIAPREATLYVQLLGGFAAHVGAYAVPDRAWRLQKARSLVKLLALAPGLRLQRGEVLDTLWPDFEEQEARHNLRTTLYVARRALTPPAATACPFLELEGRVLSLAGQGTVSTDLHRFEAAAASAVRRNALRYWQAAADLYTGDLLPQDVYEEWTVRRRETARQSYTAVLFGLARRREIEGQWPAAVAAWRLLVAHDPTHEEAHQALMRLHYLAGERRLALEQYEQLCRSLHQHLGITPDPESERLHREIIDARPSLPSSRLFTSHLPPDKRVRVLRTAAPAVAAAVYTWGHNGSGQLGAVRAAVSATPVPLRGLADVTMLAAGFDHNLALRPDGTVWAWGGNALGQLGDGTTTARQVPVRVPDLDHVAAIAAGSRDCSLALCVDGTVWGWGANDREQLGNESLDMAIRHSVSHSCCVRPTRVRVPTGVVAIAAGGGHCLALLGDGTVWGWGANMDGQLVEGADNDRGVPVQIHPLRGVRAIACGLAHSLALLTDGTVLAWGNNVAWQLGNGTTAGNPRPAPVRGVEGVVAIASGGESSFAVREDGTLWGWGQNGFGQLGIGTRESQGYPVRVGELEGIAGAACSVMHTLALAAGGTVWGWGVNTYGQLGDGTNRLRLTPVRVAVPPGATAIAAGTSHSLAATAAAPPAAPDGRR